MPTLAELRSQLPELQGLTDDQAVDAVQQAFYPDFSRDEIARDLGVKIAPPPPAPAPERTLGGGLKDIGVAAMRGGVGAVESVVGLGNLVSGGQVGKAVEDFGVDLKGAKEYWGEGFSDAQKEANRRVNEAEGLWEVVKAAVKNPSVAGLSLVESLPQMMIGGLFARGMVAGATALSPRLAAQMATARAAPFVASVGARANTAAIPVVAGALGEGVVGAGSAAEQIRQQSTTGTLTGDQASLALATGAANALFGLIGGKVAQSMGLKDIDTLLAGAASNPRAAKGVVRRVLEGFVSEGALEELPQSISEQVMQNMALDRPLDEGVNQAAVLGLMAGGIMGAGANVMSGGDAARPGPKDILDAPDVDTAIKTAEQAIPKPATPAAAPVATPEPVIPPNPVGDTLTGSSMADLLQRQIDPLSREAQQPATTLTGKTGADLLAAQAADPLQGLARDNALAREDQRQEDRAGQVVDNLTRGAAEDAQSMRQWDARRQPVLPELDMAIQPGDVLQKNGAPWPEAGAKLHLKAVLKGQGQIIPVAGGGYIVRPKKKEQPDEKITDAPGRAGGAQPATAQQPADVRGNIPAAGQPSADVRAPARAEQGAAQVPGGFVQPDQRDDGGGLPPSGQARPDQPGNDQGRDAQPTGTGTGVLAQSDAGRPAPADDRGLGGNRELQVRDEQPGEGRVDARVPTPAPAELANGFFQGPAPGERYRVSDVSSTGGLLFEKRLPAGTVAAFYVDKDGGLVDSDNVNLIGGGTALIWRPKNEQNRQEARDILQQMGALALSDPKRAALKERLKALVKKDSDEKPVTATSAPAPAPVPAPAGPAEAGQPPADRAAGAPGDQPAADAKPALNEAGDRWTRMPAAERSAVLDRTAAKDRAKARIVNQSWDDLADGWRRAIARSMGELQAAAPTVSRETPPASQEDSGVSERAQTENENAAKPRRRQPGEPGYTLQDARDDLLELRTIEQGFGIASDARLTERIRRQEKLIKEMEAADQPRDPESGQFVADDGRQAESVASPFTGKPDPRNSAPMQELDGFKVGDVVDVPNRTFGQSTIEILFTREMTGFGPMGNARLRREDGKTLDVLTSELKKTDGQQDKQNADKRYNALIEQWNDLSRRYKAADDAGKAIIQPAMDLLNKEIEEARGESLMGARRNIEAAGKVQQASEAERFKAMPIGSRMRPSEFTEDKGIFWEKTGADEWTGRGEWFKKGEKRSSVVMGERGGMVEMKPAKAKPAASANTIFTDDMAAAARARLKAKLGRLGSGIDPEMLQDGIVLAGNHVEKGARTFAAFARAMLDDMGEAIRPYLKQFYMAVKYDPRSAGFSGEMSSAGFVDEFDIAAIAAPSDTEAAPGADTDDSQESTDDRAATDPTGPGTLDEVAASQDGGAAGGRGVPGGDTGSGQAGRGKGGRADGDGVPAARSRGGRTRRARPAETGAGSRQLALGEDGAAADGTSASQADVGLDPEQAAPPNLPGTNYRITDSDRLGQGGEVQKFNDNIAAIRVLAALDAEQRRATPSEQRTLARYVGWGGLPSAFPNPLTGKFKDGWEARGKELRELLNDSDYDAAKRSTLDAHYTSQTVVTAMWDAVRHLGFKGGLALESSMGTGNFLGLIPEDLAGATKFVGVEYDATTARVAEALYPQSTVLHAGFHKVPVPDDTFALNIGNPPFGSQSLTFQFKPELRGVSIHNQFFRAALDSVRPGGVQALVVSRFLMDAQDKDTRLALAKKARLLGAIRLPDTAFKENARTEVVTDIVFLQKLTEAEQQEMDEAVQAYTSRPEKDHRAEHERQQLAAKVPDWVETTSIKDPLGGEAITVNGYFAENPKQILGVLERSGSMQHGNDVTVRLDDKGALQGMLAEAIKRLPEGVMDLDADVLANTEARFKSLSDSLRIQLAKEEPGHLKFDLDGKLQRVLERETPEGAYEFMRQEITAESPWSEQLYLDANGRWYRLEVALDEKGEKKKIVKNGKVTKLNEYERSVYENEADIPGTLRLGESRFERLKELVKLRDHIKRQLTLEAEDVPATMMEASRKKLREAYEAFVAAHGPVNRPVNAALVYNMPDGGLVLASEVAYKGEVSKEQASKTGQEARKEEATPAPILYQRVVPKYEPATKAENAADALIITLAERGRVDMDRIAGLIGKTADEAAAELQAGDKPLVFKDPESEQWETANAYLSGPVRRKLVAAKAAGMQLNIRALEAVQPAPWTADQVTVMLGSTWVPPEYYAQFFEHITGGKAGASFSRVTNSFQLVAREKGAKFGDWSSNGAPADYILSRMLNSQPVVVMTPATRDSGPQLDREATAIAQLKAKEMADEFGDWIFRDSARREDLTDRFNDKFNTRVNRQHDGSHLTLPGKVPDGIIAMRRHQKNAIWRGIQERFNLFDHAVGAGKTFTAIARAMERRRMGLSRKPMIVVPNHLVEQFTADVYRLYPGAKVMAAGQKDFETKRRRRLFAKIATGDWDIVIVPHSSFAFIGIAPDTEERFLREEMRIALEAVKEAEEQAIEDGTAGGRGKPFGVKEAERLVDKIQARLDKLGSKKDRLLTFEQLGVDDLTVDEAHEFKNLFYSSRLTGVRGMGDKTGSQKAFDLYNKVRVLRESPTGTVTFMSGTPISNSAVEMFTVLRYLAADELRDMGLEHFDAWRAQYVEATQKFEPTESGRLKEVTRLGRSWSNMRSLMDLYYSVTDAVTNEDIQRWYLEDKGTDFPIPKVKGGERQLVALKPTPAQDRMLKEVMAAFDGLDGIPDPYERNALRLRLMNVARAVSLDVRAIGRGKLVDAGMNPALADGTEPGGKLEKVAAEVKRIYDQWTPDRGTQLIFLDRSVPKAKGDDKIIKEYDALRAKADAALTKGDEEEYTRIQDALEKYDANEIAELRAAQAGGWNAYQQIKDNLVAMGIPPNEVRFIQEADNDAKKKAMFDAVNGGKVRVLIGSTPRMGAGTNVQQRLVGLHHVDVTWKPSDIEQREGRIIRQGNLFGTPPTPDAPNPLYRPDFEVEILAYATERTVDAKMWDLNATKLKMINGIRKYDGSFVMEFEDEDSVSMAEMAALASGDPLLLERVTLESQIATLELQERGFRRNEYALEDKISSAERAIADGPGIVAAAKERAATVTPALEAMAERANARTVTVEGKEYKSQFTANAAAKEAITLAQGGEDKKRYSINIGGQQYTNKESISEAIAEALGDVEPFEVEVRGATYIRRTPAARTIAEIINEARKSDKKKETLELGTLAGFDLVAELDNGKTHDDFRMVVRHKGATVAQGYGPSSNKDIQFTPGAVRKVLEDLLETLERVSHETGAWAQERMEQAKAELPGLLERRGKPFPKADEIAQKRARLSEVVGILSGADKAAAADTPKFQQGEIDESIPAAVQARMIAAYNENITEKLPEGYYYREVGRDEMEMMFGDPEDMPDEVREALDRGEAVIDAGTPNDSFQWAKSKAPNEAEFIRDNIPSEDMGPIKVTDIENIFDWNFDVVGASDAFKVLAESEGWDAPDRGVRYFTIDKPNDNPKSKEDYPLITIGVRISDHSRTARGSRPSNAIDININMAPQQGRGNEFHGADDWASAIRKLRTARLDDDGELKFGDKDASKFEQGSKPKGERRSAAMLQYEADAITDLWRRKPTVIAVDSWRSNGVPAAVRREAEERISRGGAAPRAVFADGRVYLFAEALDSKTMPESLYHEVLGHYGMWGHFGEELDRELEMVATLRQADMRRIFEQTGMDPNNAANRIRAAEEVVAYLAQTRPNLSVVQRIVAAIRNWLRENVPGFKGMEMSDADIIQKYILPARQYVEGGGPRGPGGKTTMEPAFQGGNANRPFYSALARGIEGLTAKALPVEGWRGAIKNLVNTGKAKADEVEWSGLREWLEIQTGKVSKDDVLNYLQANGVQVQEVMKGGETTDTNQQRLDRVRVELDALGFNFDEDELGYGRVILTRRKDGEQFEMENGRLFHRDTGRALKNERVEELADELQEMSENAEDGEDVGSAPVGTRYSQYTLPGGENYREVLLTLPGKVSGKYWAMEDTIVPGSPRWLVASRRESDGETVYNGRSHATRDAAERAIRELEGKGYYRSSHWDEPNILAHIRLNDRTDADGKKVLFVEEVQSDWAQEGKRKGFDDGRTELTAEEAAELAELESESPFNLTPEQRTRRGELVTRKNRRYAPVPRAPFVGKTDAWVTLALKRIVKMAVDGGYDRVAFVTGQQSAERYSLAKTVDSIEWGIPQNGTVLTAIDIKGGSTVEIRTRLGDGTIASASDRSLQGKPLADVIGKEVAERILSSNDGGKLQGDGLKIGGEGMMTFYDKIVPAAANKLLAKLGGGKMASIPLGQATKAFPDGTQQPGFDITDAMREKAAGGLPLFQQRRTDQTETPEFRAWFGDSKVVDAEGKPLVVYHGTGQDFDAFAENERGIFFAEDPETAAPFSRIRKGEPRIIPAYVSIKNPWTMIRYGDDVPYSQMVNQSVAALKAQGYDGTYSPDDGVWVAFEPTQIKSATGNRGTFDPASPNIMFQQAIDDGALNQPRDFFQMGKDVVREMGATPGKLHWWHKSVGTQYNLARKNPMYRRVFERVQDFLNDVSLYATEAADAAPNIMPKLESWRDILKTAMPAADAKAIQAPIFEGTLTWARDADGQPVKVMDLEEAAKALTTQDKAQEMLRRNLVDPKVLRMWQGLPIDQYEQAVNTRYQNAALRPGIVWTDAELKRMFKLDDKQIGLYREALASVKESITRLALSDMVRYAGDDVGAVREEVMGAKDILAGAETLRDQLLQLRDEQPERADVLEKTANKVMDKAERAQKLIAEGYFPLMRFGHYTVTVRGEDGAVKFFSMYENRFEAQRAAQKLSQDLPEGDFVTRGTMNEEAYKLFAGVTPETLELFGEMLGLEGDGTGAADKVFQSYLKLARDNRSSMKRLIHRKGTAGFSDDVGRVLAGFVYSNARQISRNLHQGEIDRAVRDINDPEAGGDKDAGELGQQASRLAEYIKNPVEEAQALRGLLFAQYLGGSIASAAVNMTQPFAVTMPWLSQYGGMKKAGAQMASALKVAWAKKTGDDALDAALKKAEDEGIVAPQEVHHLMAQAQGRGNLKAGDGTAVGDAMAAANNALSRLTLAWGKPFATAELFNRRVTFVAAYRTAVEQKIGNPYAFAERAIRETQFIYNKGNRPQWARGAFGATLFTFKTYSISYLELLERMWNAGEPGSEERAAGRRAVFFAMGMLLLLGGGGGLPFMEDVEDVVDGVAQRMGYNFSLQQKRREFFQEAFGKAFGGFLEKGVSGLPGAPIDVAGRLGLGNVLPGTGLLQKKDSYTSDVTEMIGPAGDLFTRVAKSANMAGEGRIIDAGLEVSPTAARNVAKSIDMAATGIYKDTRGYKVLDVDAYDALAKAIGFQPGAVATVQEGDRAAQLMVQRTRARESEIAAKWAKGFADNDDALKAEARAELQRWNEKNPETPIRIRIQDVLKRAQKMRQSRAERIASSAPREVREEARRLMGER